MRSAPGGSLQEGALSAEAVTAFTGPPPLLQHMAAHSIQCMASGGQRPNFKFFFYAQRAPPDGALGGAAFFLVELQVNTAERRAMAKLKAEDSGAAGGFSEVFRNALRGFGAAPP